MKPKTARSVYPQVINRITRLDKMNRVKNKDAFAAQYLEGLFTQIKHIRMNNSNPMADKLFLDEILNDALTLDELRNMERER